MTRRCHTYYGKLRLLMMVTAVIVFSVAVRASGMGGPAGGVPAPVNLALISPSLPLLPDTTSLHEVPFIRFNNDANVTKFDISDDDFYAHSTSIVYPQSKWALPKRSDVLRQLENEIIPEINRNNLTLRGIIIRGAASPEGPLKFNVFLSIHRAQSLINFINARLTHPMDPAKMVVNNEPEDYRYLQRLMHAAGDPDTAYIDALCEKYLPSNNITRLKYVLRHYNESRLWNRLYRQYFPPLRAARFILVLAEAEPEPPVEPVKPDTVVKAPVVVSPLIKLQPSVIIDTVWTTQADPRREVLSVGTNLLFYGVYMPGYNRWCPIPNVSVEYYPLHGHFTFGASFDCPWWKDYWGHKYFEVRNYQLEARYYLRSGGIENNAPGEGHAYRGLYFQAYAHAGLFDICFDANRGWEGEGFGGGLGLGYVLPIGGKQSRWRLEFNAQVGFFRAQYDPYQWECPVDPTEQDHLYYYKWTKDADLFKRRQYRFNWFGPTRIGITLSYDLLYRRKVKKGVSFKSYEPKLVPEVRRTVVNVEGGEQ